MTTFEIAKDHFTKTDNSLFVKVNGNDYELTKNWFGAWESTFCDLLSLFDRPGTPPGAFLIEKRIKTIEKTYEK